MALFISEQVAAVTAYNAGNPQFTVYYGENAAEAARQALLAEGYADAAAQSAAFAGGFEVPEYATQAAGNVATSVGDIFRVPRGTTPQTFTWYRRAEIDSDGSSLDLNFTTADFESYALSEEVSPLATTAALPLIQRGTDATSANPTITFNQAFKAATTPKIYCQIVNNSSGTIEQIEVYGVTNAQFTVRKKSFNGAVIGTANYTIDWLAIGENP